MTKREELKKLRKEYKDRLELFCRVNLVKQREIAAHVGITEQELYNVLNGFQDTVSGMDFQTVWNKILSYCGKDI